MTDTPNPEPIDNPEENLDWNADELGSMADHATDDDVIEFEETD